MTTRSLEDSEIRAIFGHIDGCNAKRMEDVYLCRDCHFLKYRSKYPSATLQEIDDMLDIIKTLSLLIYVDTVNLIMFLTSKFAQSFV